MHYCPDCQQPYSENDYECPRCGYSPSEEGTTVIRPDENPLYEPPPQPHVEQQPYADEPPHRPMPPYEPPAAKRNSAWLWIGGILAALALLGLAAFAWYMYGTMRAADDYRKAFAADWKGVVTASDDLTSAAATVNDPASLKAYAGKLSDYRDGLIESKARLDAMAAPVDRQAQHAKAVQAVSSLISYSRAMLRVTESDPLQVTDAELETLSDATSQAKEAVAAALTVNPFLNAPDGLHFRIAEDIKPIVVEARTKAKAAAAAKAAAEKARLEAEKKKAEAEKATAAMTKAKGVVDEFMSDIMSHDYNAAGRLLEGEAAGGYDPSIQGQGDFQETGYTVSDGELTDLGNFRFYVTVKNRDMQGAYFEDKWKFVVSKESFLINRRQMIN